MKKYTLRSLVTGLILAASLALISTLTSCGTYQHSVQVDDHAYLLIIGNPDGNIAIIDDGKPIDLGSDTNSFSLNGQQATKIEIGIGKHTIRIERGGNVVVDRTFFVSTGTSFEVKL